MEPTLSQALHLLNGDTVNAKIQQGGLIPKLLATKKFPEERITELYIRACRASRPRKSSRRSSPSSTQNQGSSPGTRRHLLGLAQ